MKKTTFITEEMEETIRPLFSARNFNGYYQYLETWGSGEQHSYCWRFYILGFTPDNRKGYILKWDQTYEIVKFDEYDRIKIDGIYYSHRYWNH